MKRHERSSCMASPQIEDGYTRIANELMEALCSSGLSGVRLRLMLHVMRATYGYQTVSRAITYGDVAQAVKINRQHAVREMNWLVAHGYLAKTKREGEKDTSIWSVQKDYTLWGATKVGTTEDDLGATKVGTSTNTGATNLGSRGATKVGTPPAPPYMEKENLKKERVRSTSPPPAQRRLPTGRNPDTPNREHPAVVATQRTLRYKPTATQCDLIADSVTDLACWQDALNYWLANNYRTHSIGKLINRYQEQLAQTVPKPPIQDPEPPPSRPLRREDGSIDPEVWQELERRRPQPTHATYRQ